MSEVKFERLYDTKIIGYVRSIQQESYNLKKNIFKNNLMANDVDKNVINHYLIQVNALLKYWDEYSQDLMKKIKSSKGVEGVYTIDFQWVKEMIYADYDYASILPFVDGIIKGISSDKFQVPDDVEDFKYHTISKAFKDLPNEIGAVVDSVTTSDARNGISVYHKSSKTDAKLFDSIRSYAIFNQRDRKELYKAISACIEFITDQQNMMKYFKSNNTKMFISIINNIIDYITYSIVVYICRIYLISSYAYPFIEEIGGIRESVSTKELKAASGEIKYNEITTFRNTDDIICRDPDNTENFIEIFISFIKEIGAEPIIGTYRPPYSENYLNNIKNSESNKFCSQLNSNALFLFLDHRSGLFRVNDNMSKTINELNQLIKELIFNSDQGMQGTSSPKQELFHVIRGVTCDNNLKSYQELAVDLYLFSVGTLGNVKYIINYLTRFRNSERQYPQYNTTALNLSSESIKIMAEFYRDLTTAITHKARDIEMKINELRSKDINVTLNKLKLNIDPVLSTNNSMMVAVPDTTRMPMELMDVYSAPTFESYELYDEYVKYTLNAYNDMYFSEAFKVSELWNALVAKIKAMVDRLIAFYNDKSVKAAFKWVHDHEDQLLKMDYSGAKMEKVIPYKKTVILPPNFNNLANGLKSFTDKDISDSESVDEFIKKLYPNDTIYGWFNNTNNDKINNGALLYKNFMLFYDLNEVKPEIPAPKVYDGVTLPRAVKDWIETIKGLEVVINNVNKLKDDINSGLNVMKNRLTTISNNTSVNATSVTGAPDISKVGNDKSGTTNTTTSSQPKQSTQTQNPTNQQNTQSTNAGGAVANAMMGKVTVTIDQLVIPLSPIFIEYIKTMYKYLQEAYSMGRKVK